MAIAAITKQLKKNEAKDNEFAARGLPPAKNKVSKSEIVGHNENLVENDEFSTLDVGR